MKIILYGTEFCPWCQRAEEFFEENKIKFKYIDVGKDKESGMEMIEKSGQKGVPVIEIDDEIIIGFDEARIRKKLRI